MDLCEKKHVLVMFGNAVHRHFWRKNRQLHSMFNFSGEGSIFNAKPQEN
jgi:hypothetical protein